jgi:putative transposase
MADVPQESSRGNGCDGLLYNPNAHVWFLYCFFVIGHDRSKILHFNVTRNPNALWIVQQLEEGWAYKQPHRFLPFDRDSMFGADVVSAEGHRKPAHPYGLSQSLAERCCRTLGWKCRRDLLDHVIVLNERHLKRLMSEYVLYYQEDRYENAA